eukprot:CAMPEP_0183524734 /NCGR_PEP_ID=MMETSP0371-20130417/20116_1 /TAXON_ID=268820 /ORGANISM="Peridinium aciculiferum, Strain PAER-2" /LENGTH=66 /DNA_ID=CAMNT_0025723873 /DNA_START=32 /DNA_END=228 /DNA_ORIENTATION=-
MILPCQAQLCLASGRSMSELTFAKNCSTSRAHEHAQELATSSRAFACELANKMYSLTAHGRELWIR